MKNRVCRVIILPSVGNPENTTQFLEKNGSSKETQSEFSNISEVYYTHITSTCLLETCAPVASNIVKMF